MIAVQLDWRHFQITRITVQLHRVGEGRARFLKENTATKQGAFPEAAFRHCAVYSPCFRPDKNRPGTKSGYVEGRLFVFCSLLR